MATAVTEVRVHRSGDADECRTDAGGVAVIRLRRAPEPKAWDIEARDKAGNAAQQPVNWPLAPAGIRSYCVPNALVYRAADRIQLHVFSTRERGTAYMDVVKMGKPY